MTVWTKLPIDERKTILSNVAEEKGIVENAVEKDYWVSMVLRGIFTLPYGDSMVFKGGTSLSKGWSLVDRFSEDLDIAVDRKFLGFSGELKKSERTKLRKESKRFVENELSKGIESRLADYGLLDDCRVVVPPTTVSDLDPAVLFVEYGTVLDQKISYIPERVKIEVSCRSLMEPFEKIGMRSMIEDAYPEEEFTLPRTEIPTVLPGRTFLEKVFLLHEEFTRPGGCSNMERLTRHMYDIVMMMDKPFAHEAINNTELYNEIVEHRRTFTAWSGLDYGKHSPQTISFVPPSEVESELQDDYAQMRVGFIYKGAPDYEVLIERLKELQSRFRSLR